MNWKIIILIWSFDKHFYGGIKMIFKEPGIFCNCIEVWKTRLAIYF